MADGREARRPPAYLVALAATNNRLIIENCRLLIETHYQADERTRDPDALLMRVYNLLLSKDKRVIELTDPDLTPSILRAHTVESQDTPTEETS
jgi:hypothetical protein